jgi:hypothetical protein
MPPEYISHPGANDSLAVFNAFDVTTPTQMQGNPYLIGPPGFAQPYMLGSGIPTNDGSDASGALDVRGLGLCPHWHGPGVAAV